MKQMKHFTMNTLKTKKMKAKLKNQKAELIGKTFYDCRMDDYFTVINDADNNEQFVNIEYKKKTHRNKREAVSYVTYHIDEKQYLPKIV
jgi:hypothetical protein